MNDTADKLRDIIESVMGAPEKPIVGETKMADIYPYSLDFVDIVMEIERIFYIGIDDEDMDAIQTFGDLVKLVEDCLS